MPQIVWLLFVKTSLTEKKKTMLRLQGKEFLKIITFVIFNLFFYFKEHFSCQNFSFNATLFRLKDN